jgi:hypothetical protein
VFGSQQAMGLSIYEVGNKFQEALTKKSNLAFLLQISSSTNLALLMSYLYAVYSQWNNKLNLCDGLACWNRA